MRQEEAATCICWLCLGAMGKDPEVYKRINSRGHEEIILIPRGYPCDFCEFLTRGYENAEI